MSLLWYWIGYVAVTWVGIGHTIFNILVLHMKSMAEGPGLGQGYESHDRRSLVRHQHRDRSFRMGAHQTSVEPHIQAVLCRVSALDHDCLSCDVYGACCKLHHSQKEKGEGSCKNRGVNTSKTDQLGLCSAAIYN